MRKIITTKNAPAPIGPYSQGVSVGSFIFVSGQGALTPDGLEVKSDIKAETKQTMENLKAILEAAGVGFEHVVKVNIYLTDMGKFPDVNSVYATYFKDNFPARATVGVATLPRGFNVEIECVAYVP